MKKSIDAEYDPEETARRRPKIAALNLVAVRLVLIDPPIAHAAPSVTGRAVGFDLVLWNICNIAIRFGAARTAISAPSATP
jgi:hypothetical protein